MLLGFEILHTQLFYCGTGFSVSSYFIGVVQDIHVYVSWLT